MVFYEPGRLDRRVIAHDPFKALVAPRPLLLANTDKDGIFPLEGIERIHQQVRKIYRLYGADKNFGLQVSEGPHKDIQELQVAAFQMVSVYTTGLIPLTTGLYTFVPA